MTQMQKLRRGTVFYEPVGQSHAPYYRAKAVIGHVFHDSGAQSSGHRTVLNGYDTAEFFTYFT